MSPRSPSSSPVPTSPLVLVTGAAGRLGRRVAKLLHEEGCRVRATDVAPAGSTTPFEFHQANLLDHEKAAAVVAGATVIVHLGNHPTLRHPQTTFNENVAMNMNVFQAAAEHGARTIIFASTVQLVGSQADTRTIKSLPDRPRLPLTGGMTPRPANNYALSKHVGEIMLRHFAERCQLDAVAIRFPAIISAYREARYDPAQIGEATVREAFSCITFDDAARLILAVIRADLSGFRIYLPGTASRFKEPPLAQLIRAHLPGTPETLEDLIDNAVITRETGWTPSTPA